MSNARFGTMNWKVWYCFFSQVFWKKKHKFCTWAWSLPFAKADKVSSPATISQRSLYSVPSWTHCREFLFGNLWVSLVHLQMPGFVQGNWHGKAGECVYSVYSRCAKPLCKSNQMNNAMQRWPDGLRSWPWLRADLERPRCVYEEHKTETYQIHYVSIRIQTYDMPRLFWIVWFNSFWHTSGTT